MHFALTVKLVGAAREADEDEWALPNVSLAYPSSVKASFTSHGGDGSVHAYGARYAQRIDRRSDAGIAWVDLVPDEPRRLLFDASALSGRFYDDLVAGTYTVDVSYEDVAAPLFDIVLRRSDGRGDARAPTHRHDGAARVLARSLLARMDAGARPRNSAGHFQDGSPAVSARSAFSDDDHGAARDGEPAPRRRARRLLCP